MATNNLQTVDVVIHSMFSQLGNVRAGRTRENIDMVVDSPVKHSTISTGLSEYFLGTRDVVKFSFSSTCREVLNSEVGPLFRGVYAIKPSTFGQCVMKITLVGPDYEYAVSLAKNEEDAKLLLNSLCQVILRVSKVRLVGISTEKTIQGEAIVLYAAPTTHHSLQIGLWILMHTFKEKRLLDLCKKTSGVFPSTYDYIFEIINIAFDRFKGMDTSYTNKGMAKSSSIKEYLKEPQNDTGSDYFSMLSLAVWCVTDTLVGAILDSKASGPVTGILSIEFPTLVDSMIQLFNLLSDEQKGLIGSLLNKASTDIYGGKKHPMLIAYRYVRENT